MDELDSVSEDAAVLAIAALVRRYAAEIRDPDVAADVAQEVTIACAAKWRAGRLPSSPPSLCWLIRKMVRHRAYDWSRSTKRRSKRDLRHYLDLRTSTPVWMSPDMAIEDGELQAFYAKTLASLSKTSREVYVMIREDGASYKEVGKRLGISCSGVYWHLAAAQRRFRQGLEKRGGPTDRPHH